MTFIFLDNLKSKSDQQIVLASEDFTEETTASEGINIALPGKAIFQGNRTNSLGKLAFRNVTI